MCRLRRETEVAHDTKKHGVTVLYSSLDSGQLLVQRRLCGSKCADSIHNSSKLPRTDMNMLGDYCAVYEGPAVSVGAGAEGGGGRDGGDKSGTGLLSISTSTSENRILSPRGVLCYLIWYLLLILLLENKRYRHGQGSLHGQD